ncbi:MAG TPA: LLM class flavin-dependent oxidoreductase [Chloroflexota bacterium]|nr:LLM class flavin-dependent oxidoreductase [Chloroflexota bacterium]
MRDTEPRGARGVGLAAGLGAQVLYRAAEATLDAGYSSFWLNNPPGTNALRQLGGLTVPRLRLGVGVIPVSHVAAADIVTDLRESQVPLQRLYLGIGSGGAGAEGLARVRAAVAELRSALDCTIVVAALGPRMCRLAGELAEGVLLNWLTPDWARTSAEWIRGSAHDAGRPPPRLMAYVRVALGDPAQVRLREEARRYEAIPGYAAHFRRMRTSAIDTCIQGDSPSDIQAGLRVWNGVLDELVVRVITANDTVEEIIAAIEAARPHQPR